MSLPEPIPGLVIRYSYLWRDEALGGAEQGRKDRPCVIVLSVAREDGRTVVTVAPITHSVPRHAGAAIEIPGDTQRRLKLDGARSWVVAADLNRFVWPGPDLTLADSRQRRFDYGVVPRALYRAVRDRVLVLARTGGVRLTERGE